MNLDPRSELFQKVMELVDDIDLECFSLSSFTKEKSTEILKKLEKSKSPKEDILEMLSDYEEDWEEEDCGPFKVVDMTDKKYGFSDIPYNASNIVKCIAYLNDLIGKFIKGEALTMTTVCLLKDGKSPIWIPDGFSHKEKVVNDIFEPVIAELKSSISEIVTN